MRYIFFSVMILFLSACVNKVPSVELGFYLLGENPDTLVTIKGVPNRTYKSNEIEVYEYTDSYGMSLSAQSIPNYSYSVGYRGISSIDTYGSVSSYASTSKYIIKNNKIISFTTPDGSGQIN